MSIGILYRIKSFVPRSCLKNLFHSIIHPYYLYCLPIFGATYSVHLEPLRILQKRAIRIVSGAGFLDHTTPLFHNNKILKLDDLYKHRLGCFIYENQHLLGNHTRSHNYETRNRDSLLFPRERLRSSEQSVIYNCLRIWDSLPNDIKTCRTFSNFKYRYKNFLLNQYI